MTWSADQSLQVEWKCSPRVQGPPWKPGTCVGLFGNIDGIAHYKSVSLLENGSRGKDQDKAE